MPIQCLPAKRRSTKPEPPLSEILQPGRSVIPLPRRRGVVYKAAATVLGRRRRAASSPRPCSPAVPFPVSPPSPVLHESLDVHLGDCITLSLTTPFGGVPVIKEADFYRANTSVFGRHYEQLWYLLSASGPAAYLEHLNADGVDEDEVSEGEPAYSDDGFDSKEILKELLPMWFSGSCHYATLSLNTYLLSGRIFSAFAGTASYVPGCDRTFRDVCGSVHNTTLVAKIHRPVTHTVWELYETASEAAIYDRLPEGIAPRYHGLFIKMEGERMVACILEHAGTPITTSKAARALSLEHKEAIVDLYTRLHAEGVIHVSCTPKHWLRTGGCFRLIDFGCRWVRDGAPAGRVVEPSAFRFQAAEEMAKVRRTLGLPVWAKA
ncbi:hypothetical protein CspeluHIS016_0900830 [Cutaneotrichosporon spelunceum]|uniref:Protein kinase domain-containing protein n=1 Tax=Cutaneotrichosporon spelunceum TaxID=1672016 RepID=A0AAD3U0A7_9TREE|nr:hypothetical protein CspeluHIS016_0900830 [Cutaneotrichosporon spelunceum]